VNAWTSGAKVASAFDVANRFTPFAPFTTRRRKTPRGELLLVVLPHPSGLSRTWHEPGAFERARATLREAGVLS